ncbi:MAG: hypothetical protein AAFU85_32985 [Planctomycetota bacterium]
MRAQCECGLRHRVTTAQIGRPIRCVCGNSFDVPSLRELRKFAAENVIGEIFGDREFWNQNGCFLCKEIVEKKFLVSIILKPELYQSVVVGPDRRGVPILSGVLGALFCGLAALLVSAADHATKKTQLVLVQAEDRVDFPIWCCRSCTADDEVESEICRALLEHKLYLEMREDYPAIRISQVVRPHSNGVKTQPLASDGEDSKAVEVVGEYCSFCDAKVVPDEDERCPRCKWPID